MVRPKYQKGTTEKKPRRLTRAPRRDHREEPRMAGKVYQRRANEVEGIRELVGGALLIPSFTEDKFYKVHVESGYCTCPHHTERNAFCKHLVLGEAVEKARKLRFGSKTAEDNVIELCSRIFASLKGATCQESYALYLEVLAYRRSTERMIAAAIRRHHRMLSIENRRVA